MENFFEATLTDGRKITVQVRNLVYFRKEKTDRTTLFFVNGTGVTVQECYDDIQRFAKTSNIIISSQYNDPDKEFVV